MSSGRPSGKKKGRKTSGRQSSNGLLLGGVIVALVVGLGIGAWVVVPRLFPKATPEVAANPGPDSQGGTQSPALPNEVSGSSQFAQHELHMKATFVAMISRFEVNRGITDAASAKAAVPSLRRAIEQEIAANDAWKELWTKSPPTESDLPKLREIMLKELQKADEARQAADAAKLGIHISVDNAISMELQVLRADLDRLNTSLRECLIAAQSLHSAPPMLSQVNSTPPTGTSESATSTPTEPLAPASKELSTLPESPPEAPPTWESPPDSDFRRTHGDKAAHVRLVGLASEMPLAFMSQQLMFSAEGGFANGSSSSTATAQFVSVAPIMNLEAFSKKIASLGKVLDINQEQRVIVLWISPASQKEFLDRINSLPGADFPGGPPNGQR